jgi:hypothetical protein
MGSRPICSAKRGAFTAVFPPAIRIPVSDGFFHHKFWGNSSLLFLWKFFGAEGIIEGEAKMTDQQLLARIVPDPKVMVGKPVIRGTRRRKECVFSLNI